MIDGQPILNMSVYIAGVMLCFLGILMLAVYGKTVERRTRIYFVVFFLCLAIDLVLNFLGEFLNGNASPQARGALLWVHFLHRFFSPLLAYIVTMYLISALGGRHGGLRAVAVVMCVVYNAALTAGQIFRAYFYIDEGGVMRRGEWYSLLVALSCMPLILDIVILLREGRSLTRGERAAFWVYSALPACAVISQVFIKGVYLIIPATIVAALAMFIFIIADKTESYYEQQRIQTEMGISMMLSQIQPHFLYNALDSIYYLCSQNPALAQRAIADFSQYLRVNLNSLKQREPVLFEIERQHTETYLKLEKMSMGEDLTYEFDCETEDFFIPVLTLQTLVENAVKHGISEKQGGGRVCVRTRSGADSVTVSIEDDGAGFDTGRTQTDGKAHIGIENVRERLRLQCGGTLTLTSVPGEGTKALITIPKGER